MSRSYSPSPLNTKRRTTRKAQVGAVGIGGDNPIRVQSMLTSDTRDTDSCVEEALGLRRQEGVTEMRVPNIHQGPRLVQLLACDVRRDPIDDRGAAGPDRSTGLLKIGLAGHSQPGYR